jgi:uncharacterized protein
VSTYLSRGFKNLSKVEAASFRAFIGLLLLLVIIGGLIAYKTTASLAVISKVQMAGGLQPRFDLIQSDSSSVWFSALDRTLNYFSVVWPALLFGVLISGAVRAFISPASLASLFGRGRARAQLVAGLAGAPLMLCSCCVAPVFTSVYERSSRLAPSLALMLASPSLNPAALVLTFMLFGGKVGAVRLLVSGMVVLFTGIIAEHLISVKAPACPTYDDSKLSPTANTMANDFLGSCLKVGAQTLPLIFGGVVISMLVARWLPVSGLGAGAAGLFAIMVIALVAVPLAMPTFFEMPLALMAVAAGLPAGAAVAMLIAGPATNLPSLFTVARSAGWKVSAFVALMVWASAVAAGLFVSLI